MPLYSAEYGKAALKQISQETCRQGGDKCFRDFEVFLSGSSTLYGTKCPLLIWAWTGPRLLL